MAGIPMEVREIFDGIWEDLMKKPDVVKIVDRYHRANPPDDAESFEGIADATWMEVLREDAR